MILRQRGLIDKGRNDAKGIHPRQVGGGKDPHGAGPGRAPAVKIAEPEPHWRVGRAHRPHQQGAIGPVIRTMDFRSGHLWRTVQPFDSGTDREACPGSTTVSAGVVSITASMIAA